MIDDPAELGALLADTPLAGRRVRVLEVPGSSRVVLALEAGSGDPLAAWEVCRGLVGATGRWPVLAVSWGGAPDSWSGAEIFGRFPFEQEPGAGSPDQARPEAVIERAADADPRAALETRAARALSWRSFAEALDDALAAVEERIGEAPDREEVLELERTGGLATYGAFERWLLAWEAERARGDETERLGDRYLDWFGPRCGQPLALYLLPTPRSAEVLGTLHFFGCEGFGSPHGIALLRRWEERWGAELVGHHGTMLELRVERPPETLGEAIDLAWEQATFAECTTIPAGIPTIHHARTLVGRTSWFLHERP